MGTKSEPERAATETTEPRDRAPLAVYTDDGLWDRAVDPCSLLVPFLVETASLERRSVRSPYARYWQEARSLFRLSGLEDSDFAVLPFDWSKVRLGDSWLPRIDRPALRRARAFFERVEATGRTPVVFFSSERSSEPLPHAGLRVFRRALYRSRRTALDHVLPAFPWSDLLHEYFDGAVPVRRKGPRPVVGFCGFARGKTLAERAAEFPYQLVSLGRFGRLDVPTSAGIVLRLRCVNQLELDRRIDTNFLLRGDSSYFKSPDPATRRRLRDEFAANMRDSDYVLCCRGSSNFSFRLYETLACGRIPVFLDTDSVLPFEDEIDWRSLCVWVKEGEVDRIGERVAEFHDALSPDEFEGLQLRCREIYERWLTPHGFFRNFHRLLRPSPERRPADGR